MWLLLLQLVVLLNVRVFAVPVMETQGCSAQESSDSENFEMLRDVEQGLLNNTENVSKIKSAFSFDSNTVKVCVPVSYTINCTDQEECGESSFNCSASDPQKFIWTSFNPFHISGRLLLQYGSLHFNIFGFEWEGACNISNEDVVPLFITVPALCATQDDVSKVLGRITEKMPTFANQSGSTSSYSIMDEQRDYSYVIVTVIMACIMSVVALLAIYSVAKGKIETKKNKGYFQFWASHIFFLGFTLYTIVEEASTSTTGLFLLLGIVIWGVVIGTVVTVLGFKAFDLNTPVYVCCQPCMACSHVLILWISIMSVLIFTALFIFLIPNITLVYYLYPTRTLIRLPLLINSVIYINSLIALFIFQCERLAHLIENISQDENELEDSGNDHPDYTEVRGEEGRRDHYVCCYQFNFCHCCRHYCTLRKYRRNDYYGEELHNYQDEDLIHYHNEYLYHYHGGTYYCLDCCKCLIKCFRCLKYCMKRCGICTSRICDLIKCFRCLKDCMKRCGTCTSRICKLLQRIQTPKFQERKMSHDMYYNIQYNEEILKKRDTIMLTVYCISPIATLIILAALILLIIVISDLILLHQQNYQSSQLELVLTLVPTLILLFGSWYKLDTFFVDEEEKSKEDQLAEAIEKSAIGEGIKSIANHEKAIQMSQAPSSQQTAEHVHVGQDNSGLSRSEENGQEAHQATVSSDEQPEEAQRNPSQVSVEDNCQARGRTQCSSVTSSEPIEGANNLTSLQQPLDDSSSINSPTLQPSSELHQQGRQPIELISLTSKSTSAPATPQGAQRDVEQDRSEQEDQHTRSQFKKLIPFLDENCSSTDETTGNSICIQIEEPKKSKIDEKTPLIKK